jgi:tripartite-type tricarboxylate transporter receptor subunit TctC
VKLPRRRFLHLAAGAAASSAASRTAQAQSYPTRPIQLVVPFPPGGAFDALARPWADKIRPLLGTVFIDDYRGAQPVLWVLVRQMRRPAVGS